jgi:hypothetical protein
MKASKPVESIILTLRGQKVILDADLAELCGVPTKALNQTAKRNADRSLNILPCASGEERNRRWPKL